MLSHQDGPIVEFATNKFINTPVILQFEDKPLIEVVKSEAAGYDASMQIYNKDGVYLAKVVGSRLHLTPDGEKSGLKLLHPQGMTVCELNGKTLFEVRRSGPAALKAQAEIFTPNGLFIKSNDREMATFKIDPSDKALKIRGIHMIGNTFVNMAIGILLHNDGGMAIGVSRKG